MARIEASDAARRDLVAHLVYLTENAGESTADRFYERVQETLTLLATQPDMGAPLNLEAVELQGTRKWRVKDFGRYLVFYLPLKDGKGDGVHVLRVLHAAQDWWHLLGLVD